jgi:hypothetical protein
MSPGSGSRRKHRSKLRLFQQVRSGRLTGRKRDILILGEAFTGARNRVIMRFKAGEHGSVQRCGLNLMGTNRMPERAQLLLAFRGRPSPVLACALFGSRRWVSDGSETLSDRHLQR